MKLELGYETFIVSYFLLLKINYIATLQYVVNSNKVGYNKGKKTGTDYLSKDEKEVGEV